MNIYLYPNGPNIIFYGSSKDVLLPPFTHKLHV